MMLIIQDVDDDDFVDATETLDQGTAEEVMGVINAILGDGAATTFQIHGFLKRQKVEILIDTGSTHNMVHSTLTKRLCLPVHSNQIFQVGVARGCTLRVDNFYKKLQWSMANSTFLEDFLVLDVGRFDIILGAQWLWKLGQIILDMDQHFMAFSYLGRYYELHGVGSSQTESWECNLGRHDFDATQHVFVIQMGSPLDDTLVQLSQARELSPPQQTELAHLLQAFSDVFEEPTKLPLERTFDHRILLRTQQPVSCCPYRYGPIQKDEI